MFRLRGVAVASRWDCREAMSVSSKVQPCHSTLGRSPHIRNSTCIFLVIPTIYCYSHGFHWFGLIFFAIRVNPWDPWECKKVLLNPFLSAVFLETTSLPLRYQSIIIQYFPRTLLPISRRSFAEYPPPLHPTPYTLRSTLLSFHFSP